MNSGDEISWEKLPGYPHSGWEGCESLRGWMEPRSLTLTSTRSRSQERGNEPGL